MPAGRASGPTCVDDQLHRAHRPVDAGCRPADAVACPSSTSRRLLVFGRFGRADAEGAFATCHCLTLPTSEPGYYFWRDRATGELTRRSEWFVTKSPTVRVGRDTNQVPDLVRAAALLRSVAEHSRKAELYPGAPAWVGKLDTIVHELYHIDPEHVGHPPREVRGRQRLRAFARPALLRGVARMVKAYLASRPDPALVEFLRARLRRS